MTSPAPRTGTPLGPRRVACDGSVNFRDVGGYVTEDGRAVRWRHVYRSGNLARLTDTGLATLVELDVRVVFDLRAPHECERDPSRLPQSTRVLALPVFNPADHDAADALGAAITSSDPELQHRVLGDGRAAARLLEGSRTLPTVAAPAIATFLRTMAEADGTPAIVHCTAGKDRTGLAVAVLLRALGVPPDTVMEDYLLSNPFRAEANEVLLASAAARMADPELLRPMLEVREEYLLGAFETIEGLGGFEAYRRDVLEVDDGTVEQLRARLLE